MNKWVSESFRLLSSSLCDPMNKWNVSCRPGWSQTIRKPEQITLVTYILSESFDTGCEVYFRGLTQAKPGTCNPNSPARRSITIDKKCYHSNGETKTFGAFGEKVWLLRPFLPLGRIPVADYRSRITEHRHTQTHTHIRTQIQRERRRGRRNTESCIKEYCRMGEKL